MKNIFVPSRYCVSAIMKHPPNGNVKLGHKPSSVRIKAPKKCYSQKVNPCSLTNITDVCLKSKLN